MKKLLFLIPLLLIVFCASPFALYKDTVSHGTSLDSASPSHWKILSIHLSSSGTLGSENLVAADGNIPKPAPYSQGASFKGFPIGAYFSRSATTNTYNSSSLFSVSAISWLWSTIDLLIILATLYYAIRVNKQTA